MVILRSGIVTDKMDSEKESSCTPQTFETQISLLELKIEELSRSLQEVQESLIKSIAHRNINIDKLQTRINVLESEVNLSQHFAGLFERKFDDMEQISRKVNLRLKGIEVFDNDSPQCIMDKIKQELVDNEVDIPHSEIDRCHRDGFKYRLNGKTYQDVLIKFGFWRSRDVFYANRKKFSFRVLADLTQRRSDILSAARYDLEYLPRVSEVIDFVFSDQNCKLKLKSKSNRFYGFNSHDEFLTLVDRLGDELLVDVNSLRRKHDEVTYDLFY